ncbi:recombination protein recR [Scardovia wiggsiae F0424]|uniref:Recombination protein RecR n=1 Tax=Scardovia wiggsiae F0424 TaxID=857290 RepID=J0WYK0_9BIFI|nr:recombination mediator RecR [Scardovia wiggsiae]EJD64659.1 recombination protein recR [Scardovia wiggsiae F0424]
MPAAYEGAIRDLIDRFADLPGIGPKGAQRIAFYLLSVSQEDAQGLAESITAMRQKVQFCEICGNVCEKSPCTICADPRRDRTKICVVQEPKDIMSIERTHEYRGVYHVLGGAINPMSNIGPQDLKIAELLDRLKKDENKDVAEIIFALNPDIEGEATTTYLSRLLAPTQITLTQLASGLPMGSDLEYADEITLGRALAGRREV